MSQFPNAVWKIHVKRPSAILKSHFRLWCVAGPLGSLDSSSGVSYLQSMGSCAILATKGGHLTIIALSFR